MKNYKTPGVYIEEKSAFPNSAVAVETAIPAFIGYTYKAERNGKSLLRIPTRINSLAEYKESFGGGFKPKFQIESADDNLPYFKLGDEKKKIGYALNNELYFFNSIRLFYANGGGPCIIVSIGTYGDASAKEVLLSDFMGTTDNSIGPLEILEDEQTATLVVMPDIAATGKAAYPLYSNVLLHCAKTQSRFGVFDLKKHDNTEKPDVVANEFRNGIGENNLNYGAAYYPWLNASIVSEDEINFENFSDLKPFLETEVCDIISQYSLDYHQLVAEREKIDPKMEEASYQDKVNQIISLKKKHHLALKSSSSKYNMILAQAVAFANEMPPSGALVGLYTMVDNHRGVWKAPANFSLNEVKSPMVNISSVEQESFNIDPSTGKSINVIRSFQGLGTLVWGARTLDGNSNDWKYINVRRTLIMIEQSIKTAARAYVFEPNDANTWATVKAMILNFLTNLWKQGALMGAVPEQAFDVQIGLGSTMTPTDILEGKMLIVVKLAIVRPDEFIVITFQQQLQQT